MECISIREEVDKEYVALYEELNYKIVINNYGNDKITNCVLLNFIPEMTSFIKGSLKINDKLVKTDIPEKGVTILEIEANEEYIVNFSVRVTKNYIREKIEANSVLKYDYYRDNPLPYSKEIESEKIISYIRSVDFNNNFKRVIYPEVVEIGEEITIKYILENKGNVSGNNIIIKEIENNSFEYIEETLKIDDVLVYGLNPYVGINLGIIKPNHKKVVEFNVRVKDEKGELESYGMLEYVFLISENGETKHKTIRSEISKIEVMRDEVSAKLYVNKNECVIGEEIEYKILLENKGSNDINNLKVDFCSGRKVDYIKKNVDSNGLIGKNKEGMNENILKKLKKGQKTTLLYRTIIKKEIEEVKIVEKCRVTYNVSLTHTNENIGREIYTNDVTSNIEIPKLDLKILFSKDIVSINEEIEKTIIVRNMGTLDGLNVVLYEEPSNNLNINGITLGDIKVGDEVIYKCNIRVIEDEIFNYIKYSYKINQESLIKNKLSEKVKNIIGIYKKIYKDIVLDDNIKISNEKKVDELMDIIGRVVISKKYILKDKLNVTGYVEENIQYINEENKKLTFFTSKTKIFTTMLDINPDDIYKSDIPIKGTIININFEKLDRGTIYSSVLFRLEY